jgi:hypothetical protein
MKTPTITHGSGLRRLPEVECAFFPSVLSSRWKRIGTAAGNSGWLYEERSGLRVIASAEQHPDGKRWIHVSVSRQDRLPSWDELVAVKELFIGAEREAVQFLPPRSQWVNMHDNCLHIWHSLERSN